VAQLHATTALLYSFAPLLAFEVYRSLRECWPLVSKVVGGGVFSLSANDKADAATSIKTLLAWTAAVAVACVCESAVV
jgi:hypothetical protein